MNKTITKVFGLFVAVAIAVTASVPAASALTADELLNILISAGLITDANLAKTLAGGSSTGGSSAACGPFTTDLTMGSTGAEVVSLQTFLEGTGNLTIPAGVSKGYFGNLTRSALAAYQASMSISPAVGYFGPITRANVATKCVVTSGGDTGGSTGSTGEGITTIGEEGTISVTLNPNPSAGKTVREGQDEESVIGFKIEASNSDVLVQRVKLELGTSSTIYTKIFSRLYVTNEDGDVLTEKALNSSTVTKDGSTYTVTITGFDFLVKEGDTEVLIIKADLKSSIKTADQGSKTITLPTNGIRATDGAGIDQYGPSSAVSRSVTVGATLLDSAALKISTNTDTPVAGILIASDGSDDDELNGAHLLSLDLKAEKDDVLVTDATVTMAQSGSGAATSSTVYLYRGSTLLGTASVSNSDTGIATFSDIDFTVSKDKTDTIVVKVDIDDANTTAATMNVSAVSFTAENSEGTSVTPSGSAVGESFTVFSRGPMFELVGSPTISKNTVENSNVSTTSVAVTFNVKVTAKGGDVMFGTVSSTSPAFGTSTTYFNLYKDGASATYLVASTTGYSTPSTGVSTSGLTNSFTLTENNSVTIPVTFTFENRTAAGALLSLGSYAVGMDGIKWVSGGSVVTTSHMSGDTDWQSSGISLP